ncbi:hypothetical protein L207DRAFT_602431 [Hyaloscypha variabilis F]|uniref:Uncharacterized protein n=1 Tax=Hyaloscypha variabilis (strain UAMH 11265 / GT02V1 / F) TaxID=1149755 RepID=A0A2J6RCX0_HYAVF|nr:hypothetical protein L207DRAFT_602431 [Hyaloscypha variabilis F]
MYRAIRLILSLETTLKLTHLQCKQSTITKCCFPLRCTAMKYLPAAVVSIVLYAKLVARAAPCFPLTTDALCASSPGTISSDGFDDVCVLVACCNSGSPAAVELPSGKNITCLNVNCKSVCSLANMRSGLGNEACNDVCVPTPFNWAPLVQRACSDYNQAKGFAPQTLGYFGQVLNIVCAAAKSTDPCCDDMRSSYGAGQYGTPWAGPFTEYIFNVHRQSYLGPNAPPFNTALQIANEAGAIGAGATEPGWLLLAGIGPNEVGSVLAGSEHFYNDLGPAFANYINMLVQTDAATCDAMDLNNQISALQSEHQSLFTCAVVPGFTIEGARGQLSPIRVGIADMLVPAGTGSIRTYLVDQAIRQFYTPNCGLPTNLPSKRTLGRRQVNNASTSTIAEIQTIAAFLNLTAPQDAPLEYDPRAWVPTIQAPASVSTLPSAHLQILPNTSAIVIEAGANSTGLVHVSADRSALHSEAVVALCINTASPNVTDTPSLTTAYPVPNTSLFVFGLISVIFPATAPIGNNSYLFDGPGINATFAQYLN